MSDIDRFEIFMHVAEASSLTQAAQKLKTTKASLSKHIKKLEEEYRVDLFNRTNQRLHLTPEGQILLDQCKRLIRELDDTRSICKEFHDEPEGILHISAFEYFANKLLFPKLNNFLRKYPKLEIIIDVNEHIPNFEKDQVDLAIGFALTPSDDSVIQKSMYKTRYVLCASPDYFKEYAIPKTLKDLHQHKYIEHKIRATNLKPLQLKPKYVVTLKPFILLNRVTTMIECAKLGLGLVQLPLYMVESFLDNGELIEVLEEYQATDANVYYYYSKYRYIQPKVRKFIDYFLTK